MAANALRSMFRKLVELIDEAEDDVLAFTAFPLEHWAHLSSADPLEGLIKGIKRWALVVRINPIDASIIHFAGSS